MTNEPLGLIFSRIDPGVSLLTLGFSKRIRTVLKREERFEFRDLAEISLAAISTWRSVGNTSLTDLATTLVSCSLIQRTTLPSLNVRAAEIAKSPSSEKLLGDLATIARWKFVAGQHGSALLDADFQDFEPLEVLDARARVLRLSATDLQHDPPERSASELLDSIVNEYDERRINILRRRVFADNPETLDSVAAAEGGLTRERVRQIEAKTKASLRNSFDKGLIGLLSASVREQIDQLTTLEALSRSMPALTRIVPSVGQPVWRLLSRIDQSYEIDGEWCASPTIESARTVTISAILAASMGAPSIPMEMAKSAIEAHLLGERACEWLNYCGFNRLDNYLLVRGDGISDRAEVTLLAAGEPLIAEDILANLGIPRSINSLKNAMATDSRFARVNRNSWGLSEWGLDTYRSIRELIGRELSNSGGSIPIADLIDRITAQYTVSHRSVVAYAAAPPFETVNGIVADYSGAARNKSPFRTPRLFRRPGAWVYRTIVSDEHVRGSGSILPNGIAEAISMGFGETREFESRLGTQKVAWKSPQVTLGSIRRFIQKDDLEVGSTIFLCFSDDGRFDIDIPVQGRTLMDSIFGMMGQIRNESIPVISQLSLSIGQSSENGISELIAALRRRGDADIAEILEAA